MKIAIMQPYFLPYIGYFQLINAVDKFVVYDNIEYTKKGWFNRNRFLMDGKEKLFTIPLKKDSDFLNVNERFLSDDSVKARKTILAQIQNQYRNAPFFKTTFPLIEKIFLEKTENLFDFIYHSIVSLAQEFNLTTELIKSSTLGIEHNLKGQAKVIEINKFLKSDIYINSIGGQDLYDKNDFAEHKIKLLFLKPKIREYKQFEHIFVPSLSILDVMMFNSVEEIQTMLNDFELI